MTDTLLHTEVEAAELEGLVAITPEQLALVKRRRQLQERKDKIDAELKEIRDTLKKDLESEGRTGLLHNGKAIVKRIVVKTNKLDGARFKKEMPELASTFVISSEYVRVDIN